MTLDEAVLRKVLQLHSFPMRERFDEPAPHIRSFDRCPALNQWIQIVIAPDTPDRRVAHLCEIPDRRKILLAD